MVETASIVAAMRLNDLLKRIFVGDRSQDVDRLAKAIAQRLMLGAEPSLAELAQELMQGARPGYAAHQISMAAQILVNQGQAVALSDGRPVEPVIGADPHSTRLRAHRR